LPTRIKELISSEFRGNGMGRAQKQRGEHASIGSQAAREAQSSVAAEGGESCAYDVAIIGSGIAGSTLAALLARHGQRVLVLEAQSHPRFSIGESMILETSEVMRTLAELYDVPELAYYSSENFMSLIGTSHGVKRHFSFLHHSAGAPHDRQRTLQAVIPRAPYGHELHLFRQDVDGYLTSVAIAYGATVLQNTLVQDIELFPDYVDVITAKGDKHRVRYVVDAGGFRSLLAERFGWRERTMQTHSRALFTHMVNVPDYHAVGGSVQSYGVPYSVAEGTLHHIFHGGWLWVIPFNNHPRATNPLCSIGLMLDERIYPLRDDLTPEEEFQTILAQFPSIAAQLHSAHPVRPWTRTGRIGYSASQVVGDRFCLLGHAAGFVDPLYSKGLYITTMTLSVLADLLLQAHQDGDYSATRFRPLEETTLAYVRSADRLVANSYKSWSSYRLWSVYSVLWLLGAYCEYVKLTSMRLRARDRRTYYAEARQLKLAGGGFAEFDRLAAQVDAIMEALDVADAEAVLRAEADIRRLYAEIDWMPEAFQALLDGKKFLPKQKLRITLLSNRAGFMGSGDYRRHFFGQASMGEMITAFLRENISFAPPVLRRRNHPGHIHLPNSAHA
jgi:FADH2 O2-dependent halogenase